MIRQFLCFTLVALLSCACQAQRGSFLSLDEFRQQAFGEQAVNWQALWISAPQRAAIEDILGRRFPGLRIRYLRSAERSAWVFEEIGKELPITFGVVVEGGAVAFTRVLEYREVRGGEIRYPFFTDQFRGARLRSDEDLRLDRHIDGITGATLSVRAMKKIVRLALYCHRLLPPA